jgi:hypothetical protein
VSRDKRRRDEAWREVLATHSGRVVVAEILKRCHHGEATTDQNAQLLQQLAWELLADANLMPDSPGSLPVEYVSMLTRTKLDRDAWAKETTPEPTLPWYRRLLGRNK